METLLQERSPLSLKSTVGQPTASSPWSGQQQLTLSPSVGETIGRGRDCGELRPIHLEEVSQFQSIEVMWECGHGVDRTSEFLMEARNLPSCVKCPDFQMLALFPILNILQTKQNASWLPACNLCVASDFTAVPLDGT